MECIETPEDFEFRHSLTFLKRSPKEVLHRVEDDAVTKALVVEGKPVVFRVSEHKDGLGMEWVAGSVTKTGAVYLKNYVRDWFDLHTDLKPFYHMARKDELLKPLVKAYKGYRIVGQPDLFESLVWAVLGQQINLSFAYTLKSRFVSSFGQSLDWSGVPHYVFPTPDVVSRIRPEELLDLQFSRQKAAYTINIAEAFLRGDISREKLAGKTLEEAKAELRKIKGVGNWTANYALMKTYRYPDAFPLEDAGLHNAIKRQLGLASKPSVERVRRIFRNYRGWEAYATLYLWRSLAD
ncbi:MAG: DNA-3-methyladenine glycosylase 2 [Cyclobacteriaceae bacterium]|nr:DNA-3-methyladenine glycosylase 2 [Cyclobacteriaceae bacterium]